MEAVRTTNWIHSRLIPRTSISLRPIPRRPTPNPISSRATYTSTASRLQPDPTPPPPSSSLTQAQPLSGYYAELLASSSSSSSSTSLSPSPSPSSRPSRPPSLSQEVKESRARVVFGSRLAGSGYVSSSTTVPDASWQVINGVAVPPRPAEPDNCCMSGCVHCVWDDYRDEVEGWAGRVRVAKAKAKAAGMGTVMGDGRRGEVREASSSVDEDGGGREGSWDVGGAGDGELFEAIPVGIREFMKTEKKLRERTRKRQERGDG